MLRSACFDTKRIKISGPPLYVLPRIIVLGSSRGHFGCCSFPDHFFLTFLRSSCLSMFSPGSFFQCSSQDRFFLSSSRFVSQCSSPDHFPMFFPGSFCPIFFTSLFLQSSSLDHFSQALAWFILSHLLLRFICPMFFPSSFFRCFPPFIFQSYTLGHFFLRSSPLHFSNVFPRFMFPMFFPSLF